MHAFAQKQNQPQQRASVNHTRSINPAPAPSHAVDRFLPLQRMIGNQTVQRMLQTNGEGLKAGLTGTASSRFGHDFSRTPIHCPAASAIRTKSATSQPGDEYEQEADYLSQQVMRMPEPQLQRACACGGGCPACQTEHPGHGHESLYAKRVGAGGLGQIEVPPIVHEVLRAPGSPMNPTTRAFMEPRFGYDFSPVRVHTEEQAAESACELKAKAFTVGRHIVFGAGHYQPQSQEGRRLLAHELAHVVQQSHSPASVIQLSPDPVPDPAPLLYRESGTRNRFTLREEYRHPRTGVSSPRYIAEFLVDENGVMTARVRTVTPDSRFRSTRIRLGDAFQRALNHFRSRGVVVTAFRAQWSPEMPTNLDIFNEARAAGLPVTEAAAQTPTGRVAGRGGFGHTTVRVTAHGPEHPHGPVTGAVVTFRPTDSPLPNLSQRARPQPPGNVGTGGAGGPAGSNVPPAPEGAGGAQAAGSQPEGAASPPSESVGPTEVVEPSSVDAPTPERGQAAAPTEPQNAPPSPGEPQSGGGVRLHARFQSVSSATTAGGSSVHGINWSLSGNLARVNTAIEARGGVALPGTGTLRITVNAAGEIISVEAAGMAPEFANALARQALATAPQALRETAGATTDTAAPRVGARSLLRWGGHILFTIVAARELSQTPPPELPRTITGLAGGYGGAQLAAYLVCSVLLGPETIGGSFVICGLPVGLAGGVIGASGATASYDIVGQGIRGTPGVLGGRRAAGGVRGDVERDRARLAQVTATRLPGPEPRRDTSSGGEVSRERRIESTGGRTLADVIDQIGTLSTSGARAAALQVEGALRRAAVNIPSALSSGLPIHNGDQVLMITLPLSANFPEGGHYEIRAYEVPLLLRRTQLLLGF